MKNNQVFLEVKDHSVSGEKFQLLYNEALEMLETNPQPSADKLSNYYKSEDYISHTDTQRNLFERVYHIIRKVALNKKLKLINSFQAKDKSLLDIGCGTGDFLKVAKKNNWAVTGIEPNQEARAIARTKVDNNVFDVEHLLSLNKHSFDVITLWHVLEHLPKLEEHVAILKRLLKPNGTLVIAVPNFKSYDAGYYKSFWAAYDTPRHLWHFSKTSISKLFAKQKMKVVKTRPMKFDSYYVSMLSEKYRTGSMNIFKSFWVGLNSNFKAIRSGEYSSLIYVIKNS